MATNPDRPATFRVAIADDDPESRELIRHILRGPHTTIVEAVNGAALVQLLAEQAPFDLIVTDVDMPWMEGLQALRSARAANILTPAVVVTGLARPGLEAVVARLGVTKLVRKPFGAAELREAIAALLVMHEGTRT
jgi:two-component system, OmpR family, response regulator MprA